MYTPFALSIYRGVLSPNRLGERGIAPGQFLQAARQLELCNGAEDAVCVCVATLVPGYSPSPCSMADALLQGSCPADASCAASSLSTSLLYPLRQTEMEYTALTGSSWADHSPLAAFYDALLRAEACCLLRLLSGSLPLLGSAEEARALLCRVLDEVYTLGALVGDVSSGDAGSWWRLMLKESMASLYLNLTADFSYLLEAGDFLNCPALFSSPAYTAVDPADSSAYHRLVLLHEVHIKGNEVRRLLSLRGKEGTPPSVPADELQACYESLLPLWPLLAEVPSSRSRLLSTLRTLEDAFYLATCPYLDNRAYDYLQLQDPAWNSELAEKLYNSHYSTHYRTSHSRSASYQLESYLHHRSFTFLGDDALPTGSIPRLLKQRILHHLNCYIHCFDATFHPLMPDKGLAEASTPLTPQEPNARYVHQRMAFFTEHKDSQGHPLMQPDDAARLERLFLEFLSGRLPQEPPRKFHIPKGYYRIFYGFFFYLQGELKGNKELYIQFVHKVFVTGAKEGSLKSNYNRSIEAYNKVA